MMYLRSSLTVVLFFLTCIVCNAQSKAKPAAPKAPKYQGLLWEISGNGLKKPSYVFGTMHVSSKLAFNLSDSFYYCIRNADIVALETNPERLQEDFSKSNMLKASTGTIREMGGNRILDRYAFTVTGYADILRAAFGYRPEMINHLLYRSYASREDYEEDTFLDMYIYQIGKRYGKRATGVEDFFESEKLMMEAYRDAAKEHKTRKSVTRSNDIRENSANTLTDAYRRGDLDMLDSLSNGNYDSPAFLEKFMYKRNDNMVHAIDSIVRHESLFAGVGAAHLPGDRGVISQLRKLGYIVRPVTVNNRDSEQKEVIEKMKAPVSFQPYTTDDKLIRLDIPGKLFNFSGITMLNQQQYADLANGAYYLVSRVKTNALALGQREEDVFKKIDSMLYENIPGKIVAKETITNNGYKGFDITNRTRRGDLQRYNIFVTPFEVLMFKMSGNGDYVSGAEANHFFSSIKLAAQPATNWARYHAPGGMFAVNLPHPPHTGDNFNARNLSRRSEFEATDKQTGNSYMISLKHVRDVNVLEEDTVDLGFAEESLQQSDFVKEQESRKMISYKGYPCLEIVNLNKDNTHTQTRIILQGGNYYVLSARYKKDKASTQSFFQSFEPGTPQYKNFEQYTDTSLYFSVKTPVKPKDDDENSMAAMMGFGRGGDNEEDTYYWSTNEKEKAFTSDSTGESVQVSFSRFSKYFSIKDSSQYWQNLEEDLTHDGDFVVRSRKFERLPQYESLLLTMRDTNSSRSIMVKTILKKGALYSIAALTDTLQGPSAFISTFFDSFTPADTTFGSSVFTSKAPMLFRDFYSTDSTARKQAREQLNYLYYEDKHADTLMAMLKKWGTNEKNYMDVKTDLIGELGMLKQPGVLPFLISTYQNTNDTASLQQATLSALLRQQTQPSYNAFKELILKEIPIFPNESSLYELTRRMTDSMELAATLFPELLQLTALSDYKEPIYGILATLVDSNKIKPSAYESYVSQVAFDARVVLQKNMISEQEKDQVEDGDEDVDVVRPDFSRPRHNAVSNSGRNSIGDYAVLLLPYREKNKNAARFFEKYETIKAPEEQMQLARLYLRNKLPFSDSVLNSIAKQDKYRVKLWSMLNSIDRADKFPKKELSQESLAKSLLHVTQNYNNRYDTIALVAKQTTTYRFKKSVVYYFKYRRKDDTKWYMAISGPQPEDPKKYSDNPALTSFTGNELRDDKPAMQQFQQALRKIKYRYRYNNRGSYNDFSAMDYDD